MPILGKTSIKFKSFWTLFTFVLRISVSNSTGMVTTLFPLSYNPNYCMKNLSHLSCLLLLRKPAYTHKKNRFHWFANLSDNNIGCYDCFLLALLFWCHKITVIVLVSYIQPIIFRYIKPIRTMYVRMYMVEKPTKNYYDYTFCHIFYCVARAAADNDDDHHHVIVIFQ